VLMSDHNVHATLSIIDRAYIIPLGKILFEGKPRDIVASDAVRQVSSASDSSWRDNQKGTPDALNPDLALAVDMSDSRSHRMTARSRNRSRPSPRRLRSLRKAAAATASVIPPPSSIGIIVVSMLAGRCGIADTAGAAALEPGRPARQAACCSDNPESNRKTRMDRSRPTHRIARGPSLTSRA